MNDNTINTVSKISLLPKILEAATILHTFGLINELPSEYVKKYVQANPDINKYLNDVYAWRGLIDNKPAFFRGAKVP